MRKNSLKKSIPAILAALSLIMLLPVFSGITAVSADEGIKLSKNPQNAVWPEDSTATYSVEAEGTDLSYEWHLIVDGIDHALSDFTSEKEPYPAWASEAMGVLGTDKNVFSFVGILKAADGNGIYCEISNGKTSVKSQTAIIQVSDPVSSGETAMPPQLTVSAAVNVEAGYNGGLLKLACHAYSDSDEDYSYQWYETSSGLLFDIMAIDGETDPILVLSTADAGTHYYVCLVSSENGGRAYSSVIPVNVLARDDTEEEEVVSISILQMPDKVTYKPGDKVDLKGLKVRITTTLGFADTTDVSLFKAEPEIIGENTVSITISYEDQFDVFPVEVDFPEPTPTTVPTPEPTAEPTAELTEAPAETSATDATSEPTAVPATEAPEAALTPEGNDSSAAEITPAQTGNAQTSSETDSNGVTLPLWGLILIIVMAVALGSLAVAVIALSKKNKK